MSKPNQSDKLLFKLPNEYIVMGISTVVFACFALVILIYFLVSGIYTVENLDWILGLSIIILANLSVSYHSFHKNSCFKIIIDSDGIKEIKLFSNKITEYNWNNIKNYGYYYNGIFKNKILKTENYILFFSENEKIFKNKITKKLTENTVKIYINNRKFLDETILPLCKKYTRIKPDIIE